MAWSTSWRLWCTVAFRDGTSQSLARRLCLQSHYHTTATMVAGQKWRLSHGMSRSATEYGPLTDLPDWSYVDGRQAPVSKKKQQRLRKQRTITTRIRRLMKEMEQAKELHEETTEAESKDKAQ